LESVVVSAVPGLLAAVLSVVVGIVFILLRYIFDTCGGRQANTKGYSPRQIFTTKLFIWLAFVGVTISAFAAFYSNDLFSNGVNDFFSRVSDKTKQFASLGRRVYSVVDDAPYPIPNKASFLDMLKDFRELTDSIATKAEDVRDQAAGIASLRWLVIFFCNELAVVCITVGLTSIFFRRGSPALFMAMFGFLVLFLTWIMWSVHFPMGIFVQDFCSAIDDLVNSNPDSASSEGVGYFLSCVSNQPTKNALRSTFSALQAGLQDAQTKLNAIGFFSATVDNLVPSTPTDFGNNDFVRDLFNGANANMTQVNDLVQANVTITAAAKREIAQLQFTIASIASVINAIFDIVSCDSIRKFFMSLRDALCETLLTSLNVIQGACYGIAIGLIIAIVFGIRGHKRLDRSNVKKRYHCPVDGCDRWFRFKTSYVVHLRLCRAKKSFIGVGFNFISRPFVFHMNRDLAEKMDAKKRLDDRLGEVYKKVNQQQMEKLADGQSPSAFSHFATFWSRANNMKTAPSHPAPSPSTHSHSPDVPSQSHTHTDGSRSNREETGNGSTLHHRGVKQHSDSSSSISEVVLDS
jgi:hypothetical protein